MTDAVYVHIPFCVKRCGYCDFYSACEFSRCGEYFDALEKEISNAEPNGIIDTLYIGGGTPSSVDGKYLRSLFTALRKRFSFSEKAEITVECNPESLTKEKAKLLSENGVNRVSIGLQSACDATLKLIGRAHVYSDFLKALDNCLEADITNINADVILGLPETEETFLNTVRQAAALPLTHISVYALELHAGTALEKAVRRGEIYVEQDGDILCNLYDEAMSVLEANKFNRYEVSNFAKSGYRCRHNLTYWKAKEYYGFGASACGYVDGVRYENPVKINYDVCLSENGAADKLCEIIDAKESMREYVMLGLRLTKGISCSEFLLRYGENLTEKFPALLTLAEQGFIEFDGENAAVAKDKFYVLNSILAEIL